MTTRKARIELGRVAVGNHDQNLGQSRLSYLQGRNPYLYLEFTDICYLHFIDKEGNDAIVLEREKTPITDYGYKDVCKSYACEVAEEMRAKECTDYEIINGNYYFKNDKWIKIERITTKKHIHSIDGLGITPMPPDGIELFKSTLEDQLKNY